MHIAKCDMGHHCVQTTQYSVILELTCTHHDAAIPNLINQCGTTSLLYMYVNLYTKLSIGMHKIKHKINENLLLCHSNSTINGNFQWCCNYYYDTMTKNYIIFDASLLTISSLE